MSSKICAPSKKLKTEQTSLKTSQLQVKITELVQIWSVIQNQYALSIDTKLNFLKKLAEVVYKCCTIISEKNPSITINSYILVKSHTNIM